MLGYVDGSMVSPPHFELETFSTLSIKYLAWKAADQLLFCLLLSSLTEEVIAVVVGLSTAHDVWLTLEATFSPHSKVVNYTGSFVDSAPIFQLFLLVRWLSPLSPVFEIKSLKWKVLSCSNAPLSLLTPFL